MWCTSLILLFLFSRTLGAPLSNEKPMVLFSCPKDVECYASPRNCVDDCDAAFSMRPEENGTTTFNITMLSGLGYVAVLVKEQGQGIYERAIICSFHQPRGIVARVNYPDPIIIREFFETTEPEGNTDSHHTQCSTNIGVPMPRKSEFKLVAGKWESELILDERLGIDVVPAVENARILSTTPKLNIPPPRRVPAVRASPSKEVDTEKTPESFVQKKQFEKKVKEEEKEKKIKDLKKKIEVEEQDEEDETESQEVEIETPVEETTTSTTTEATKKSKAKAKETKEKEKKSEKDEEESKKVVKNEEEEEEEEEMVEIDVDDVEEKIKKRPRKGDKEDKEEERPRFREYEDEDDEHQ
ncbi:hypothetical protein Y032_0064g3542 [Ancylostoma ceylanicum]|uniref:Uncharacterized protein n=1 Tax=Ancylostoma ceylanicum TaxID=53326 RepID=A0A016U1D3_9BILA|nr:hypothetical protein Y032_0064g3542 [Ancylostoma ceylanicum]